LSHKKCQKSCFVIIVRAKQQMETCSKVCQKNKIIKEQEVMESSAFPNKIIKMKLMKLKVIRISFMPPKITQKRSKLYVFSLETSGKHPFLF